MIITELRATELSGSQESTPPFVSLFPSFYSVALSFAPERSRDAIHIELV